LNGFAKQFAPFGDEVAIAAVCISAFFETDVPVFFDLELAVVGPGQCVTGEEAFDADEERFFAGG
jgi:hypothetical protein